MVKKNIIDMGNYVPKDMEYKAVHWCVNNNIRISPKALSTLKWSIIIDLNGKIIESPEVFEKIVIWKKIYEYYLYYYNKYENKV